MKSLDRPTLSELLERRLNRRDLLLGSGVVAAVPLLATVQSCARAEVPFARIPPSGADRTIVPAGYEVDVVVRWGDPLTADTEGLSDDEIASGALREPLAAEKQALAFGVNCDGIGVFQLDGDPNGDQRLLICVNHEFLDPVLMFPGWAAAWQARSLDEFVRAQPAAVDVMQAAVGISVVETVRNGAWQSVRGSSRNRRITALTPIEFSGPASRHRWLATAGDGDVARCLGTLGNCASGTTPWRTYLTAEENIQDYFGNAGAADFDEQLEKTHRRFGLRSRDSVFRWEYADSRFDVALNPMEPMKFGWVVEIDPFDRNRSIKKRTALGRFKHEGATTVLAADGRPVVYMGDDEAFEYFYKFVADARFDPEEPARNADLLDSGTLYVARLHADGTGDWLPLVWGEGAPLSASSGFQDQGDVLIRCREAADLLGATPLDRPEDVAVNPKNGDVYLACTQNNDRGDDGDVADGRNRSVDAANPRAENRSGHILQFTENNDDFTATGFRWNVFLLAGDPLSDGLRVTLPSVVDVSEAVTETYFGGQDDPAELSAFANPDNLGFDADGNLWIVTDGAQPGGANNGCFVCSTDGPARGLVRQFMSGPIGAEICGCEFAPGGQTLFLTVQHPGRGSIFENPISHWPDGGDAPARSSLIAISAIDSKRPFGT